MDLIAETEFVRRRAWLTYPIAVAAVALTSAIRFGLGDFISGAPFLSFLPAILIASFLGGAGPGLLSSFLAAYVVQQYFAAPFDSLWPQTAT